MLALLTPRNQVVEPPTPHNRKRDRSLAKSDPDPDPFPPPRFMKQRLSHLLVSQTSDGLSLAGYPTQKTERTNVWNSPSHKDPKLNSAVKAPLHVKAPNKAVGSEGAFSSKTPEQHVCVV